VSRGWVSIPCPFIIMDRITIYPNKELRKKLDKESEKEERSLNNLILFILNKYFKDGRKNAKRNL